MWDSCKTGARVEKRAAHRMARGKFLVESFPVWAYNKNQMKPAAEKARSRSNRKEAETFAVHRNRFSPTEMFQLPECGCCISDPQDRRGDQRCVWTQKSRSLQAQSTHYKSVSLQYHRLGEKASGSITLQNRNKSSLRNWDGSRYAFCGFHKEKPENLCKSTNFLLFFQRCCLKMVSMLSYK